MILNIGSEYTFSRRITRDDILQFADISNDRGDHHVDTGKKLMAHGLLIATLPTKLGGDLNYIARQMQFEFIRPVYEGETIQCIGRVENLIEQEKRFKAELSFRCINEAGEVVMEGSTRGMIWKTGSG